jgi:hypothetical protein
LPSWRGFPRREPLFDLAAFLPGRHRRLNVPSFHRVPPFYRRALSLRLFSDPPGLGVYFPAYQSRLLLPGIVRSPVAAPSIGLRRAAGLDPTDLAPWGVDHLGPALHVTRRAGQRGL